LKLSGVALGGLSLPISSVKKASSYQFPEGDGLMMRATASIPAYSQPNPDSVQNDFLYEDEVLPWLREIVGYNPYRYIQRFVETPKGYVWSPDVQPVYNRMNTPTTELKQTSLGLGMWLEVTTPYVDVILENEKPRSPWLNHRINDMGMGPRLYYSQIIWADQIKVDDNGQVWYHLNERFSYGDTMWGPAEYFRVMAPEELEPISPNVEKKSIEVNIQRQTVTCFEKESAVYFCRASTGMLGEDTETPIGESFNVWRKMVSSHMAGGTLSSGWDTPGIPFCSYFQGTGIAIHGVFWHNAYGERRSHGCVNVRPEDAKWIFRWTTPIVGYDPGDITVDDFSGTLIRVREE
jgi:hypothetical protein